MDVAVTPSYSFCSRCRVSSTRPAWAKKTEKSSNFTANVVLLQDRCKNNWKLPQMQHPQRPDSIQPILVTLRIYLHPVSPPYTKAFQVLVCLVCCKAAEREAPIRMHLPYAGHKIQLYRFPTDWGYPLLTLMALPQMLHVVSSLNKYCSTGGSPEMQDKCL